MNWIASTEKDTATVTIEKWLWIVADHQFRANSGLNAQQYSGLIRASSPCAFQRSVSRPAASLFNKIATLGLQIQTLRQTCNLLLPRLLSGQFNRENQNG